MAATKEDIVKALLQLDSGTDAHWTDDGLPRVDVVQSILKDDSVRRKDINEASPGFARANPDSVTEPEDVQPGDAENTPVISANDAENIEDDDADFLDTGPSDEQDLRARMQRRVTEAAERLQSARSAVTEAQNYVRKCEEWDAKARADLQRRFPPMHPSEAIKQHLDAQLRLRYERAGHGDSQIDQAMGNRGKRGWGQSARRV